MAILGIFGTKIIFPFFKELLPTKPLDTVPFLPWWYVQVAYITEEDMKNAVDKAEHCLIDQIIDDGSGPVG